MADYISVQHGWEPWRPADGVEMVAEYDRFDTPTVGVVRQHGVDYLFRAVNGLGSPVTLWAYSLLSTSDRHALEESEDFQATLDAMDLFPAVIAIVAEGYGIVAACDADGSERPAQVVQHLVAAFDEWVARFSAAAAAQNGDFAFTP